MDQDVLRYTVAAIVLVLFAWMAGFAFYLRSRGVNIAAVAERGAAGTQRALIAGAGLFDLYLVLRAPLPALDAWLHAAPAPFPLSALFILLAGGAVIIAGQSGMGASWRIGVPRAESHVDTLVTTGLHGVSRNPVYLGVVMFLAGAALAAPGPVTGGALLAGFFSLTSIIRQEERYLRERFGARYEDYAKRVRRWI